MSRTWLYECDDCEATAESPYGEWVELRLPSVGMMRSEFHFCSQRCFKNWIADHMGILSDPTDLERVTEREISGKNIPLPDIDDDESEGNNEHASD